MAEIVNLPLPHLKNNTFDYNGTEQSGGAVSNINNYNRNYMTVTGTISGINACPVNEPYKIIISLIPDTANYIYKWIDKDGNTFRDDIILEWRINPIKIKKPDVWKTVKNEDGTTENIYYTGDSTLTYNYDGSANYSTSCYKMPSIETEYSEGKKYTNVLDITGDGTVKKYKAGDYPIIFSIKHPDSCTWDDGDSADSYTVIWKILPSKFKIPVVTSEDFVYDGIPHKPNVEYYNKKVMSYKGYMNSYTSAKEYYITFSLYDKDSCSWEDETTEDKKVTWNILKRIDFVPKPRLESSDFTYDGTTIIPTINDGTITALATKYESNAIELSETLSSVIAGEWDITVKLKTDNNIIYKWENETEDLETADVILHWTVHKRAFPVPKLLPGAGSEAVSLPGAEILEYDYKGVGVYQSVVVSGFNSKVMRQAGTTLADKAGEYILTFEFLHKDSAEWEDGSAENKELKWRINKIVADVPVPKKTIFETIPVYTSSSYYIENKKTGIKTYYTRFQISSRQVNLELDGVEYEYNGHEFEPTIINFDQASMNARMNGSEDISACEAGQYIIIISLKDNENIDYQWTDETTDDLFLNWSIAPSVTDIPEIEPYLFFYGGYTVQKVILSGIEYTVFHHVWRQPLVKNYDPYIMNSVGIAQRYVSGEDINGIKYTATPGTWYGESQWNVGKYYIEFTLKHPDSCTWKDGTKGKIIYEWSIVREIKLIPKPYLDTSVFTYDGTEKIPNVINSDISGVVTSGDLKKTSAGDYVITASVKKILEPTDIYDYRWQDNTTVDIPLDWHILKGEVKIPSVSSTRTDTEFENNYQKANAAGLHIGFYWYCYGETISEISDEADACINALEGKRFDFPIYMDIEEKAQYDLGKEFCSNAVRTFCEKLKNAGYYPGLYTSTSYLDSVIDDDVKEKYTIWAADWRGYCGYGGDYGVWQYGAGYVPGVGGKTELNVFDIGYDTDYPGSVVADGVDLDYAYKDFPLEIVFAGLNNYPKPEEDLIDDSCKNVDNNINIKGIVPAQSGDNWFLIDKSGKFTLETLHGIKLNVYLVGGGEDGAEWFYVDSGENWGKYDIKTKSRGGCVCVKQIQMAGTIQCQTIIAERNNAAGTSLRIGNDIYKCTDEGYIQRKATANGKANIDGTDSYNGENGANGVKTPYGYVGSSGGGGGDYSFYNSQTITV